MDWSGVRPHVFVSPEYSFFGVGLYALEVVSYSAALALRLGSLNAFSPDEDKAVYTPLFGPGDVCDFTEGAAIKVLALNAVGMGLGDFKWKGESIPVQDERRWFSGGESRLPILEARPTYVKYMTTGKNVFGWIRKHSGRIPDVNISYIMFVTTSSDLPEESKQAASAMTCSWYYWGKFQEFEDSLQFGWRERGDE